MFDLLTGYATILGGLAGLFTLFLGAYWVLTNEYVRQSHARGFVGFLHRLSLSSISDVARIHTVAFQAFVDRVFSLHPSSSHWPLFRVSIFSSITLALGLACIFSASYITLLVLLLVIALSATVAVLFETSRVVLLSSTLFVLAFVSLDNPALGLRFSLVLSIWYIIIGAMLLPFTSSLVIHYVYVINQNGRRSLFFASGIVAASYVFLWVIHDLALLFSVRSHEWLYAYYRAEISSHAPIGSNGIFVATLAFVNIAADYVAILLTRRFVFRILSNWSSANLNKYLTLDFGCAIGVTLLTIICYTGAFALVYFVDPADFKAGFTEPAKVYYDHSPAGFCASFFVDRTEEFQCRSVIRQSSFWMSFNVMTALSGSGWRWMVGTFVILLSTAIPTAVLACLICFGICLTIVEAIIQKAGAFLLRGMLDEAEASQKVQYLLSFGLTIGVFVGFVVIVRVIVGE